MTDASRARIPAQDPGAGYPGLGLPR